MKKTPFRTRELIMSSVISFVESDRLRLAVGKHARSDEVSLEFDGNR
jgi:hypothetical protein